MNDVCTGVSNLHFPFNACSGADTGARQIELGGLEAGDLQIEVEIDLGERLQFDRQEVPIPARTLRELIVGNYVGAHLGVGEVLELEGGVCLPKIPSAP